MRKSRLVYFIAIALVAVACSKEKPLNKDIGPSLSGNDTPVIFQESIMTEDLVTSDSEEENRDLGKKYDKYACTVYDGSGEPICAGQRCGVPNGSDCNSAGACQCIERSNAVFMGYTVVEFNALLRDPQGWAYLQSLGVYVVDER